MKLRLPHLHIEAILLLKLLVSTLHFCSLGIKTIELQVSLSSTIV